MFSKIVGRVTRSRSSLGDGANPPNDSPADVPPPPYDDATVALTSTSEFEAVAYNEQKRIISMASLRARGPSPSDKAIKRTPIELVAVVDVSGSMSGAKIELMKQSLAFVVQKGLQAGDSFSIVSFETEVKVELPFVRADAAGKRMASAAITALHTKGSTNLSGGLLQGLDLVAQRRTAAGAAGQHGITRSVILFTDGQANAGIQTNEGIVEAVRNMLPSTGPCSIFAFGFGSDHSEDTLRAISEATSGGQYYFLSNPEAIPLAFADALGGLVSVVAQNARLTATIVGGSAIITKVLSTGYGTELASGGASAALQLGDLYAEDEKDLLIELELAALPRELAAPQPTLVWHLRYYDAISRQFCEAKVQVAIARPEAVPENHRVPEAIEVQRTRMIATEAMERAAAIADMGNVAAGRELLLQALSLCAASPAAQTPTTMGIMADLESVAAQYESKAMYRSAGRKATKMSEQAHRVQRSAMGVGSVWEKNSKVRMKAQM